MGPLHLRRRAGLLAAVSLPALALPAAAHDHDPWTVASPGGAITATVDYRTFELTVSSGGRQVLSTPLGGAEATAPRVAEDTVRDAYSTPAGKRRSHSLVARRLRLSWPDGHRIELLVADDGVAFRQVKPAGDAAWSAPPGAKAWLQSYRPDYEGRYAPVALDDLRSGDYGFPALIDTGAGTYALLTESGLTRQPAARLSVSRPGVLSVVLPKGQATPPATPWRVAVVGSLARVVGSDLPLSLGVPAKIADTSWIHPGRVAWSWWSDNHSPGDLVRQRAFVREARSYGWQYVLLDEGWTPGEVPLLARYAAGQGVRVMLWTAWTALRDPATRARLFDQWARWGVAGVKVDFLLSDSAARMGIYQDIARDAAARHLAVVFHGCTVPRGIQRTWPNVLTMEAVEGAERETPGQGAQAMDPRQDVDLVFTRNVLGSMDYTPVTFSAQHRDSTLAHRLAQAVAYESGLQHFADTPESYAGHPRATQILTDIPTAWDDVRLLAGSVDHEAIVARRSGKRWWIGSLSAIGAHEQTVSLSFLDPGRTYHLHLVRDNGRGGLAIVERTVTSRDRLAVVVERHGGYVAELTP
jgi:hypothetical protein